MTDKQSSIHKSVLLQESIEGLNLEDTASSKIVIDGTFGGGGHTLEMCRRYKGVKIIALDQDEKAWERSKNKFTGVDCNITFVNSNFRQMDKVLEGTNAKKVSGIILDLGLSSDQLDNSGRGFTFLKDEPLLMTMKDNPTNEDVTAKEIVNTWSEESLADIIYGYGEERFSRRIAKAIVEARDAKDKGEEIETTFELVAIIKSAIPMKFQKGRTNPATKTFQALRIAVNDELGALQEGIEKGFEILEKGGRMAVISFHSLEDRIVKVVYKEKEKEGLGRIITKRPITGSEEELRGNPRARSAKLRIIEKI